MKKKILLLIPNLGFGGAQRVFSDQSRMFSEQYEVVECVFNHDEQSAYPTYRKPISLAVPAGSNMPAKAKNFVKRCWRLHLLKRREQPDITISHMEGANYVNILSGGNDQKILVVHGSKTAPDSNYTGFLDWIQRKVLIPYLFKLADRIVPVSDGIKYELNQIYGLPARKITVIKNSFDIEAIQSLANEPLSLNLREIFSKPTIINCGRLVEQKNPLALFKVFAIVRKQMECSLLFVGDGHLKEKLVAEAFASNLKVYDHTANNESQEIPVDCDVCILGFQANPFKFVKAANLFVMASDFEGFPLALAEAMICGTPVMSTDCPTGPRELLAPDIDITYQTDKPEETPYGWLMPLLKNQTAIDQWSEIICSNLKSSNPSRRGNAKRRMKEFGRKRIEEKWVKLLNSSFSTYHSNDKYS